MEVGLGVDKPIEYNDDEKRGLNPCFNGSRSRRQEIKFCKQPYCTVLILVLMEVGLGDEWFDVLK